ncbi:GIY-YIG nuclease family protein [Orenia marismortui]|uniref:GIY-YIG nuclease family protein n=1 Tax=Orenia marismortui TaxID=46469 RepID=UPI00035FF40C|nr:GIY-YIG nuclease family protein [Orenia marismortui]
MDSFFAKTIKIFLMDGDPNSRMTCELSNWVGKAYKIPRKLLKESSNREELKNIGVYLLFGKDPESPDDDMVYIGQTEDIFSRLNQHLDKKDFWNDAIAIVSKDENLNRAHVRFLEYKLYEIAEKVGRFKIENATIPKCPSISESDKAEMKEFIYNVKLLVNTLGYKVFEEIKEVSQKKVSYFYINAARGADAKGQSTSEGFVVLKKSRMAKNVVKSAQNWVNRQRKELIEKGIVEEIDNDYVFVKDYLFSSPSTAAGVVMGRNANGLTEWKLKDGTTLKEFEKPEKS